jgi:hypothetical protein
VADVIGIVADSEETAISWDVTPGMGANIKKTTRRKAIHLLYWVLYEKHMPDFLSHHAINQSIIIAITKESE